jgi:ATP-binding cassette subfamily B protein
MLKKVIPKKNPIKNFDKDIFFRLMKYIFEGYKVHFVFVIVCILITTFSILQGTLFMQTLIDVYILPYIGDLNPDFTMLGKEIIRVAVFYLFGVIAAFVQSRLMVIITQGTQKRLRDEIFTHMESLPISYFDTHSHGDIMSVYTNDIDTLRQMISQSIPQVASSIITIVAIFISMLILNIPLTILTILMVTLLMFISGKFAEKSGKFFTKQQNILNF